VRAGRGSTTPFIGRARGGETSPVASAALMAKGRAGRAEGARGQALDATTPLLYDAKLIQCYRALDATIL
jgi:hypothetical protein